jgi:O-antigen/teichoic acid export membrane protein
MAEAIFELAISFLRSQGRIRALSMYYFVKNVGRLVILFLGIVLTQIEFLGILIGVVVFQLALTLWIYVRDIYQRIGVNIRRQYFRWKETMSFSLPIVPYGLLIWGNNFVDRYLILHILDIKKLSIYAVAYSFAAITGLFYSILGYTLYPHMAKLWNQGDKESVKEILRKGLEYYLFFAVPSIAVLTILSKEIITIFSTVEYISDWTVVFWLAMGIGAFGLYQITCYLLLLLNKNLMILNISVVALVVNTGMNLMLIPRIGILGASVTTFLSNFMLAFWGIRTTKRCLPFAFPWRAIPHIVLRTVIMSVFLLVAAFYISINNFYTLFSAMILAGLMYGATDLLSKNSFLLSLAKNL